ncbi:hypothetical protein MKX01_013915, partial [Papaver californicum]
MSLLSYELFELQSMKENRKGKYLNFNLDNVNCSKDYQNFQEYISNINSAYISEGKYCGHIRPKPKNPIDNRRSLSDRIKNLLIGYWTNYDRVQEALHIKKVRY